MALFPSMFLACLLGLSSRHPSRLVVTTKAGHLISLKGNEVDGLRRKAHNQNGLFDLLIYRLDAQTEFANSIQLLREPHIQAIIQGDDRLNELFNRITRIEGVGKITAQELLVTTNEFKDFSSSKSFACYCGIAPFDGADFYDLST